MKRIGIKITKISSGVQELECFNGGDWTRKVTDIRTDLKVLNGKALDDGSTIMMVSFIREGAIITLCHAIPGRSGDLVSAWIFIPAEISITADEEYEIIEKVKSEINRNNVDNWNVIGQLCAKDYPLKQFPFYYKESVATNSCAVRYYGMGTDFGLRELLGEKLYQDYYTAHRYVFFLARNMGIYADDKIVNYTSDFLQETIVMQPPLLHGNITVKLNDMIFSKPVVCQKGAKAILYFERPGYQTLSLPIIIGNPIPDTSNMPWNKLITPDNFYITDNENNNLCASCRIMLNGQRLTAQGIAIPEEECKSVQINVECSGTEPYSNRINLLQQPIIRIVLVREKENIIYLIDGKECPNLTECPQGYSFSESHHGRTIYRNCYYMEPSKSFNWKLFTLIGSIAGLIIGFVLGYFLQKNTPEVTSESENSVIVENAEEHGDMNKTKSIVYECLNNVLWKKAEIDSIPDLQGFFRDVQRCNVEQLTNHWGKIIDPETHPQWKKILSILKKNNDPNLYKDFQFDNNTQEINVETYIQMLNKYISNNSKKSDVNLPANANHIKDHNNSPKQGNHSEQDGLD